MKSSPCGVLARLLRAPSTLGLEASCHRGPQGRLYGEQQAHPPPVACRRPACALSQEEEPVAWHRVVVGAMSLDPAQRGLAAESTGRTRQLLTWRWRVNKGKKSSDELSALDQAVEAADSRCELQEPPYSSMEFRVLRCGYHVVQRGIPRQFYSTVRAEAARRRRRREGTCRPGGALPLGGAQLRPEGSDYPPSIGTSAGNVASCQSERKRRSTSLDGDRAEDIRVGVELGESDITIAERISRHQSTIWR